MLNQYSIQSPGLLWTTRYDGPHLPGRKPQRSGHRREETTLISSGHPRRKGYSFSNNARSNRFRILVLGSNPEWSTDQLRTKARPNPLKQEQGTVLATPKSSHKSCVQIITTLSGESRVGI